MTIPVNIITGVLGVGKTTAIRHLISQRPPNERWAIVVNEFGALGIDGAILDTAGGLSKGDGGGSSKGDGGVIIREVAGRMSLLRRRRAVHRRRDPAPPTRQARPPHHRTLRLGPPRPRARRAPDEHLGKVLRIAATIALVDMTQVARGGALVESEAFEDQVNCADVVVGAKGDVAIRRRSVPASPIGRRSLYPPWASSPCTSSREGNWRWTSWTPRWTRETGG